MNVTSFKEKRKRKKNFAYKEHFNLQENLFLSCICLQAGAWVVTAGEVVNEYDRAQHEAQQSALRKAVLLRQRKNSTAIKVKGLALSWLRVLEGEGRA